MAKRTKIVCTLGPSVDNESTLKGLINAGMDIARFNFSHGTHDEQRARMDRLRKVRREMDSPCAILLDTKGPEIRTGLLSGHEPVQLMAGNSFTFTEADVEGTDRVVSHTCKGLWRSVAPGTVILVDDGLIELAVDGVEGADIHCTVQNSGVLGERKSMNLPGTSVPLPVMTDQDRADLLFGIEQQVDFVAASFIRDAGGVREMRAFLDEHGGSDIMFISKIECHEAVENINQIIEASDGIMIARGDLGVEVPGAQGAPYPEGDHPRVQPRVQAGHHGNPDARLHDPQPASHPCRGGGCGQRHLRRHRCRHAVGRDGLRALPGACRADDVAHRRGQRAVSVR